MPRTEAANRLYEERKAAGLCVVCEEPSQGNTKCEACKQKERGRREQRLEERKANGICVACPRPAKPGCTLCQDCIDKRSKVSSEHYRRRKEAGTCYYCNRKPLKGRTTCKYHAEKLKAYRVQLKLDALEAYGGPKCVGCGNEDVSVLEIDHINGGGRKHRQAEAIEGGLAFYQWLKNQAYPSGFRVLCPTCNKKAYLGLL